MKKESETEERRIKPFASSSSRQQGLTPFALCLVNPPIYFFKNPSCFSTFLANFCFRPEDHFAALLAIFIKTNNLPLSLKDNKRKHATG